MRPWPPTRAELAELMPLRLGDRRAGVLYGVSTFRMRKLRIKYGLQPTGKSGNPNGWRFVNQGIVRSWQAKHIERSPEAETFSLSASLAPVGR